jgi:hypothetical protein
MEKICNNAHNIIDQLAKLGDKFFTINTSSSPRLPNDATPRSNMQQASPPTFPAAALPPSRWTTTLA